MGIGEDGYNTRPRLPPVRFSTRSFDPCPTCGSDLYQHTTRERRACRAELAQETT